MYGAVVSRILGTLPAVWLVHILNRSVTTQDISALKKQATKTRNGAAVTKKVFSSAVNSVKLADITR